MKYRNILVPIDSSDASLRAFDVALDITSGEPDVKIHAVCVIPTDDMPTWVNSTMDSMGVSSYTPVFDQEKYRSFIDSAVKRDSEHLTEILNNRTSEFKDKLKVSVVSSESITAGIKKYVQDNECDMIVIGNRGLGRVRSFLGSVSYGVLHEVDIPVMIVK